VSSAANDRTENLERDSLDLDEAQDSYRDGSAAQDRTYWLVRLHNGMISHHPHKTEAARDKWAERYRARGDRVETEGVVIRAK